MATIKTEHAGAKNGGGYWGRRAEVKRITKKARRQADREIAMCSREDDTSQIDDDLPVEDTYVTDRWADVEAVLLADRDDPHIDYASEV